MTILLHFAVFSLNIWSLKCNDRFGKLMDVCSGRKGCRMLVGKRPAEKVVMVGLVGQLNAGHVRRWSTLTDVDAARNVLHLETATDSVPQWDYRPTVPYSTHLIDRICTSELRHSRSPFRRIVLFTTISFRFTHAASKSSCINKLCSDLRFKIRKLLQFGIHRRSRITDRLLIASSLIFAADLWQKSTIFRNVANTWKLIIL